MKRGFLIAVCGLFLINFASAVDVEIKDSARTGDVESSTKKQHVQTVCCDALDPDATIERAAKAWLHLIDGGDFRQGWKASSSVMRCRVSQCGWDSNMTRIRCCLGKVRSRDLVCGCYSCGLRNFPAGQYYRLTYNTCFECGRPMCETIILRCDRDCACGSRWKVVYYTLR
jgi:hypothetical protein